MKKRVTIKDIAKAVNLSSSTVSRALTDHANIKQKSKERILQIAKEMGYTPNRLSRALVQKRTLILGLLIADYRPFFSELASSIQNAAYDKGYFVMVVRTDDDEKKIASGIDFMRGTMVDGIIDTCCKFKDQAVENLLNDGYPIVLANRRLEKNIGDRVYLDNAYGGYLATSHLIRLGFQRIGVIRGPENFSTGKDQFIGYAQAFKERGLEIKDDLIKEGHFSENSGYEMTKEMLRSSNPPDAIVCCDDHVALGAWRCISDFGKRIANDIAIVGHDDIGIASHPAIQLTTISGNIKEMGRVAVKMIIERIEGYEKPYRSIMMEPQLIIRNSCGYRLRSNRDAIDQA
jgi:DNA-binding LacI/PurR family transcriptional regulator